MAGGVVQFGIMVALARLLTPAEYGVYTLCLAVISLSTLFVNSLIERMLVVADPHLVEQDESLSIGILSVTASAIAFLTCLGINLFATSKVDVGVLAVMALAGSTAAGAVMPRAILRRNLRFGPVVGSELAGLVLGAGAATIGFAAAGWGSHALAVGTCVQNLVIVAVLRWHARMGVMTPISLRHAGRLLYRAMGVGGSAAAEIINGQTAPLVLGARLGASSLGLFNRSYSLVQMPVQLLVASINRVAVSALFAVSSDRDRLVSATRSLALIVGVVVAPVAAGMAGASYNLILLALGPAWLGATSIIPLIAFSAWAVMMGSMFGIVPEALRAFGRKARAQMLSTALLAVLIAIGAWAGLDGAVGGVALGCFLFMLLYARLAAQLLELPLTRLLSWLVPGLVVALPCLIVSWAIGLFWPGSAAGAFVTQIAACGVAASSTTLALYPALSLKIVEAAYPAAAQVMPGFIRRLRERCSE